jgi:hypothetical protein
MAYRSVFWALSLSTVVLISLRCSGPAALSNDPDFQHDISGDVLPWNSEVFDAANDKFTFAVFSDLTGGERERIFEIAVAQLSLLRPEFIINVGDLIEGGTEDRVEVGEQWDSFDERAEGANAPVFYVGGNHDLTGSMMQAVWAERLGRSYYHFVYKDTLFLVLDTEDHTPERMQEIKDARDYALGLVETGGWDAFRESEYSKLPENAAGNISAEQSQYFQDAIAANPDVRWTFLFMHKAAWKRDDVQTFAAIERALSERPYTVFNGHVHAYEHELRLGRDYIRLATTGGVQSLNKSRSADHITLVTVSESGADIVNLLMQGILDKTGHVPLNGDDVCFELAACD